jgi:hypothetical protein
MSNINDIINQINNLSGFKIPSSSVVYTSGAYSPGTSSLYPNATVYVPATPPYGTIPTTGIFPGGIIRSEQVLRIINALNGVNVDTIIISGSLLTSGSNVFEGTVAFPFLNDGDFLFITGGLLTGSNTVATASHVVSSSYASTASFVALAQTASYALFSEYGTGVIGATATLNQTTPATIWNFNHRLGVQYPVVTIYDNATNSEIIPQAVVPVDANNLQITFASPRSGHAVAVVGGGYFATNSGSARQLDQTVAASTWSFNHGIGDQYPVFQIYNTANEVVYPTRIEAVNLFTASIYFDTPTAGTAVATIGGYINPGTASYAETASLSLFALTASFYSGSISNAISSSYALTASYALNASSPFAIVEGAISAEVSANPSSIFLIKSGSNTVFNVDVAGNVITNGSITIETTGSLSSFMLIKNNGTEYVRVNNEGVLILHQYSTPPTAVSGGMYFDDIGNFYVGL